MTRLLPVLWVFYKKLSTPSLALAILIGLITGSLASVVYTFFFLLPFFHFFIYEIRYPKEYYFYYNLGLDKKTLWIISFSFCLVNGLVILLL